MEVHHHPHTERKKWTHYFWEFLMLFLAVFCGFLAEYQLEHTIEHQRAKEYAFNLYEDLKRDTATLNRTITDNRIVAGKLDTFCIMIKEKEQSKLTNGVLYYYSSFITWINFFAPANSTLDELKGSGNLRTMDKEVSRVIGKYIRQLNSLENEYALTRPEFAKMEELYFKIFDGYTSQSFRISRSNKDSVFQLNTPLNNDDPNLMKEFTGWLSFESSVYLEQTERHLIPIKETVNELLLLLEKKYHLE